MISNKHHGSSKKLIRLFSYLLSVVLILTCSVLAMDKEEKGDAFESSKNLDKSSKNLDKLLTDLQVSILNDPKTTIILNDLGISTVDVNRYSNTPQEIGDEMLNSLFLLDGHTIPQIFGGYDMTHYVRNEIMMTTEGSNRVGIALNPDDLLEEEVDTKFGVPRKENE